MKGQYRYSCSAVRGSAGDQRGQVPGSDFPTRPTKPSTLRDR